MSNLANGLSNAALRYLNDPKFDEKFCEDCEAIVYHKGVFCSGSGFAEPPHVECPCDFVFWRNECVRRSMLEDVIECLRDADKIWRGVANVEENDR